MVWGLPRCVWARESTAPAQGNQSPRWPQGLLSPRQGPGCSGLHQPLWKEPWGTSLGHVLLGPLLLPLSSACCLLVPLKGSSPGYVGHFALVPPWDWILHPTLLLSPSAQVSFAGLLPVAASGGCSLVAVRGLLIAVASLGGNTASRAPWPSSWGTRAAESVLFNRLSGKWSSADQAADRCITSSS